MSNGTTATPAFGSSSAAGQAASTIGTEVVRALYALQQAILQTFPDWVPAPATSSSPGTAGQVAYDTNYLYICVNSSSWRRIALTTF